MYTKNENASTQVSGVYFQEVVAPRFAPSTGNKKSLAAILPFLLRAPVTRPISMLLKLALLSRGAELSHELSLEICAPRRVT